MNCLIELHSQFVPNNNQYKNKKQKFNGDRKKKQIQPVQINTTIP